MAFSDELIRAIVRTGEIHDSEAERYLAEVLIKRRDTIGRTYLTRITPIVDPALNAGGMLTFGNAAVDYKLASAPASYTANWFTFDNTTGDSRPIGSTSSAGPTMEAPAGLPISDGAYIRIELNATDAEHPHWKQPVHVYFRRLNEGWRLVGLERAGVH
jgi:hypothetical protein